MTGAVLVQFGLIGILAVLAAAGQYTLRLATTKSTEVGWLGFPVLSAVAVTCLLYALALGLYMVLLTRLEVSTLYPVAVTCSILAVAVMSWMILGEPMSPSKAMGIVLVITGIFFIHQG